MLYDKSNGGAQPGEGEKERKDAEMKRSVVNVEFKSEIQKVWNAVTDNRNFQWRSDLADVEILDNGRTFVEKNKKGEKTEFYITNKVSCKVYELDMRSRRFKGHFIGEFSALPNGGTRLVLSEEIQFKTFTASFLAGITGVVKRMQKTYAADLKRRLGEE